MASTVGAGLLGAGLGVFWSSWLSERAGALLAVGVLLHGWGMLDRHRLNHRDRPSDSAAPWWQSLLYAVCWVALAVLAALIFTKR